MSTQLNFVRFVYSIGKIVSRDVMSVYCNIEMLELREMIGPLHNIFSNSICIRKRSISQREFCWAVAPFNRHLFIKLPFDCNPPPPDKLLSQMRNDFIFNIFLLLLQILLSIWQTCSVDITWTSNTSAITGSIWSIPQQTSTKRKLYKHSKNLFTSTILAHAIVSLCSDNTERTVRWQKVYWILETVSAQTFLDAPGRVYHFSDRFFFLLHLKIFRMSVFCHDQTSRFVFILSHGQRSRQYILPEDLVTMVQDVVDTHPGLAFLKEASEFHSRYGKAGSPHTLWAPLSIR